jgi:hypothetical protein
MTPHTLKLAPMPHLTPSRIPGIYLLGSDADNHDADEVLTFVFRNEPMARAAVLRALEVHDEPR